MNQPTPKKSCSNYMSEGFYGTSTIGERGQVVIPAEARQELGIQPGDKLMVMRHPIHAGLMVFKIDAAREFLDEFMKFLDDAAAADEGEKE